MSVAAEKYGRMPLMQSVKIPSERMLQERSMARTGYFACDAEQKNGMD